MRKMTAKDGALYTNCCNSKIKMSVDDTAVSFVCGECGKIKKAKTHVEFLTAIDKFLMNDDV